MAKTGSRAFVASAVRWTVLMTAACLCVAAVAQAADGKRGRRPARDEKLVRQCNNLYERSRAAWDTHWLGVPSVQTPGDNWMMQQIITELRPDYIIETGTYRGGTTLFYATVLAQVNPRGRIITIDVEPRIAEASKFQLWKDKVELITDSSVSQAVIEAITKRVKGATVLITLDSLHTKEHVLQELELYSPLVSRGSYLVVQDTNGPGPRAAVEEFLKEHPEFEVDRRREKFLLTFYPSGYLRRLP